MGKLGEQELEAGNHEPALSAANRAITISGLREDAHVRWGIVDRTKRHVSLPLDFQPS
jgi:hypothetical protein